MSITRPFRTFLCLLLCSLMAHVPAFAAAQKGMISTGAIVAELDRAQEEKKIKEFIDRADVQNALIAQGVSADEVSSRLASLSEAEMRQLAESVDHARAGGDILVAILIIVLIIFLIKKM